MNFMLFLPEFLLAGLAFGVLGIDLFLPRERKIYLPWITLVGLVGVLVVSLTYMWGRDTDLYDGLFLIDNFSLFFKGFFLVLGALVVLDVSRLREEAPEPSRRVLRHSALLHPGDDADDCRGGVAHRLHLP